MPFTVYAHMYTNACRCREKNYQFQSMFSYLKIIRIKSADYKKPGPGSINRLNPYPAKLINLNFQPL